MENDLQKQINDFKKRVEDRTFKRNRNRSRTRSEQVYRDANVFYRFWVQLVIAAFWLWQHVFQPITAFLWKIALFLFGIYKKLWSFFVYKRNEYGDLVFSKVRAGIFLLVSIPTITTLGTVAIDGTVFAFTQRYNEEIYLFSVTDNSFEGDDEFSVTGCEIKPEIIKNEFECDSDNTVYFRISSTWIEHIYSLLTRGKIFYSENVAATIAPGWNICVVDSWYFRIKTLYRNTKIYPKLLNSSCRRAN